MLKESITPQPVTPKNRLLWRVLPLALAAAYPGLNMDHFALTSSKWLLAVTLLLCGPVSAHGATGQRLAQRLANEGTRKDAVEEIAAAGIRKVPALLSWTRTPPKRVSKHELYVGLADVFGRLRTKEAIPFLIVNINLQRSRLEIPPWLKVASVIEDSLPAVRALIQIGPEASRALINVPPGHAKLEDRLAMIFVVSQIKGVPEAREFLAVMAGEANAERYWAEEGLKLTEQAR